MGVKEQPAAPHCAMQSEKIQLGSFFNQMYLNCNLLYMYVYLLIINIIF